ncbi:MAG: hypothetical protein WAS05_09870 [Candidatus Nanopelagicales bacterium]
MKAENLVLRDLLVPFSHGLWMSLIGGAIWIARSGGKWISRAVIGYFAVVVVLHTIWDYAANIGAVVAAFVTGRPATLAEFNDAWIVGETVGQLRIQDITSVIVLIAVAVVAVVLAKRMWQRPPTELVSS